MSGYSLVLILTAGLLSFQGVRLERRPKVDEVARMRVTAEIDMQGTTAIYSALQIERVVSVEPNGEYVVESRQAEAKVKYGQLTNAIPEAPARLASYRSNGELLAIKSGTPTPSEWRTARLSSFISPGKEVKIGDAWAHEFAASAPNGVSAGRTDYRIESSQKVGDRLTYVVRFDYRESGVETPASSSGKMWIDVERGVLLRLESQWKNAPMAGAPAPLNAKITIVREEG